MPERSTMAAGARADELFGLAYAQLRCAAERQLALEPDGHTLQPTALIHEVYLRLAGEHGERWADPAYFFAAAARAMRRILVEHARRKKRPKRGGGRAALPLEGLDAAAGAEADWVMLDDLMGQLAGEDERAARLAELRIFGGMELAPAARLLGISEATAKRDWVYARAWLRERFVEDGTHGP